jgi:hypothetical protein
MRKFIVAGGLIFALLAQTSQPSVAGQVVDRCYKRCGPLLANVTPRREAQRVFRNCYVLCHGRGLLECPGHIFVDVRFGFCPSR